MSVSLHENYKFDKLAIEWRRSVVLQKLSQGYNQSEIARELQLHPSTISLDCQWIREKSRKNIQTFVEEKLAEEVDKAFTSYNSIIKKAWETANTTEDDKTRLQALHVIKETVESRIDLVANVDVVMKVMDMVRDKRKQSIREEDNDNQGVTKLVTPEEEEEEVVAGEPQEQQQ